MISGNRRTFLDLPNLSSSPDKDQRLPEISSSSSRQIKRHKMEGPQTVDEHVSVAQASHNNRIACDSVNFTTVQRSRNDFTVTPPKPSNTKDLHRLVEQIYELGSRSPQLLQLVLTSRSAIPLRLAITSAEYIQRIWENQPKSLLVERTIYSQQQLINYIANLLHKVSPSIATLFAAVFYVGRLRKLYPKANGEPGCGHRLFTISLLISYRYLECREISTEQFYSMWSYYSNGIFQPGDLLRMELEFVAFLKFNLYITYDDFEYFVDRVYNSDGGQIVPRCLNVKELAKPIGGNTCKEEDAFVPCLGNVGV